MPLEHLEITQQTVQSFIGRLFELNLPKTRDQGFEWKTCDSIK